MSPAATILGTIQTISTFHNHLKQTTTTTTTTLITTTTTTISVLITTTQPHNQTTQHKPQP